MVCRIRVYKIVHFCFRTPHTILAMFKLVILLNCRLIGNTWVKVVQIVLRLLDIVPAFLLLLSCYLLFVLGSIHMVLSLL